MGRICGQKAFFWKLVTSHVLCIFAFTRWTFLCACASDCVSLHVASRTFERLLAHITIDCLFPLVGWSRVCWLYHALSPSSQTRLSSVDPLYELHGRSIATVHSAVLQAIWKIVVSGAIELLLVLRLRYFRTLVLPPK